MNPFDLNGLSGMMGGFQKQMEQIKGSIRAQGTAGGGLVQVTVTGDLQVAQVVIAPGAMGDRELLEDLVRAATNDAMAAAQREIAVHLQRMMGGMSLPPGLLPF